MPQYIKTDTFLNTAYCLSFSLSLRVYICMRKREKYYYFIDNLYMMFFATMTNHIDLAQIISYLTIVSTYLLENTCMYLAAMP